MTSSRLSACISPALSELPGCRGESHHPDIREFPVSKALVPVISAEIWGSIEVIVGVQGGEQTRLGGPGRLPGGSNYQPAFHKIRVGQAKRKGGYSIKYEPNGLRRMDESKAHRGESSEGTKPVLFHITLCAFPVAGTHSTCCGKQGSQCLWQLDHKTVTGLPLVIFMPLCTVTADPVIKR